jgi:porin
VIRARVAPLLLMAVVACATIVLGLSDQYALEFFYRMNLTAQVTLTPDIQFVKNPALNPSEDSIWVFGLRARLAI